MIDVVIDISHHQSAVDFRAVAAAGILGVIHKATQGTAGVDSRFRERRARALGAGLLWGAYHFATGGSGTEQADHFMSVAAVSPDDLLVLDWEDNPGGARMRVDHAREFVERVGVQTGRVPGLYSGNTAREALKTTVDEMLGACWLWAPRYGGRQPLVQRSWETWTMWQWTDKGEVDGVKGLVDRNKFNGDEAALRRLWGR